VLAIVVCAIALSLAYPVREYLSERRQIGQLEAQRQQTDLQLAHLRAQQQLLSTPAYIEQQAQDQLHMCAPGHTCYEVIGGTAAAAAAAARGAAAPPWYQRVWASVQQADSKPAAGQSGGGQSGGGKQAAGKQAAGRSGSGKPTR